jgi:hypothetical protein
MLSGVASYAFRSKVLVLDIGSQKVPGIQKKKSSQIRIQGEKVPDPGFATLIRTSSVS